MAYLRLLLFVHQAVAAADIAAGPDTTTLSKSAGATGRWVQQNILLPDPASSSSTLFGGLGGVSSETSTLLPDFEPAVQEAVYDALFNRRGGAALQVIKVAIGGDGDGEPSHMHTSDQQGASCFRGPQWEMLLAARSRNPKIVTHALAWAAPGWVGNATTGASDGYPSYNSWMSQDMIDYLLAWLRCAKSRGAGPIDYIGIRNEVGYTDAWRSFALKLVSSIQRAGFSTRLVLADQAGGRPTGKAAPELIADLATHPELASAVSAVGLHYPCGNLDSSGDLAALGLPVWSTEDAVGAEVNGVPDDGWASASMVAGRLNRGFVQSNISSTLLWAPVWAIPADIWKSGHKGMVTAMEPWSGAWAISAAAWAVAMTTQFTEVGDRILSVADGGSGWLHGGGSYVTYVGPGHITIVLETAKTGLSNRWFSCPPAGPQLLPTSQAIRLRLPPVLLNLVRENGLALWQSNATAMFVRCSRNISLVVDGSISLLLSPDSIYTLSTSSGQFKTEAHSSAPSRPLTLPYTTSFDETTGAGRAPQFGYSGAGAFEVMPCEPPAGCGPSSKSKTGNVVRQMVLRPLQQNGWHGKGDNLPAWVVGDTKWQNYSTSIDTLLETTGVAAVNHSACRVQLCARVPSGCYTWSGAYPLRGICLELTLGSVRLLDDGTEVGHGAVLTTTPGTWRTLTLQVSGTSVSAQVDGKRVLSADVGKMDVGRVGLTSGFHGAVFDNLSVRQAGESVRARV
jgi:hypothetical protein